MGLLANVFRMVDRQNADGSAFMQDCTNNGWSSRYNQVCVVNFDGPFNPSERNPGVVVRLHPSKNFLSVHAVLVEHETAGKWTMMGGNFLHCSDSRFGEGVRELMRQRCLANELDTRAVNIMYPGPVAIHDRIEG